MNSSRDTDAVSSRPAKKRLPIPFIATIGSLITVIAVLLIARFVLMPKYVHNEEQVTEQTQYLSGLTVEHASEKICTTIIDKLPEKIDQYSREGNRYVSSVKNEHPVVFRCGVRKPAELHATAKLRTVSGVTWFTMPLHAEAHAQRKTGLIWVTVDRPVNFALWIPADASTAPLQDISKSIGNLLPSTEHKK